MLPAPRPFELDRGGLVRDDPIGAGGGESAADQLLETVEDHHARQVSRRSTTPSRSMGSKGLVR